MSIGVFDDTDVHDIAIEELPQLSESEVSMRWHGAWFDGPLNGTLLFRERTRWFVFHHMDDDGVRFYYVVFALEDQEVAAVEHGHQEGGISYPPASVRSRPLGWFIEKEAAWRRLR